MGAVTATLLYSTLLAADARPYDFWYGTADQAGLCPDINASMNRLVELGAQVRHLVATTPAAAGVEWLYVQFVAEWARLDHDRELRSISIDRMANVIARTRRQWAWALGADDDTLAETAEQFGPERADSIRAQRDEVLAHLAKLETFDPDEVAFAYETTKGVRISVLPGTDPYELLTPFVQQIFDEMIGCD
jgi:hypothetical protein